MNILQILPKLDSGGVERGVVELTKYLCEIGHRVFVVSSGGYRVSELENAGGVHIRFPVHRKNPISMWKLVPQLETIIEENRINIVHARSRVPAWISWKAIRRINRRRFKENGIQADPVVFVTTCHGLYSKGPISYVMGLGKRVIVPSNLIREHMVNQFGVLPQKIVLIERGVDLDRFRFVPMPKDDRKIFVVVGRLSKNKGQDIAIMAFAKVFRDFPQAQLWIVGEDHKGGKYKRYLESLVSRYSLEGQIRFLGAVSSVEDVIAKSIAVIVPSVYPESFGRVVLEAGAVGRVALASDIPSLNELVKDKSLLFEPGNYNQLAEKMKLLLRNLDAAERLGIEARRISERFDIERMCESTLRVYTQVYRRKTVGIIKFSSVGDVALAGYLRQKVVSCCAPVDIVWIGSDITSELWGKKDWVINIGRRFSPIHQMARFKTMEFDVVFDLQNSFRTHLLAKIISGYRKVGYLRKLGRFTLTDALAINGKSPLEQQTDLLKKVGVNLRNEYCFGAIDVCQDDVDEVRRKIEANFIDESGSVSGSLVGIVVDAGWKTKMLESNQIVKIIRGIVNNGDSVVLIGSRSGLDMEHMIMNKIVYDKRVTNRVSSLVGKTRLDELFALVKNLDFLITPDSAMMHIGFLFGTKMVVFFGPTSSHKHLPLPEKMLKGRVVVVRGDKCSPCYEKKCPKGERICLVGIEDEIVSAYISLRGNNVVMV